MIIIPGENDSFRGRWVGGVEINEDLCDLTKDSETITDSSQVINDLYIKHFEKDQDNLKETLERNIEEIFSKNK